MSRSEPERVIQQIILDVQRSCAARGRVASGTLVAFMVKAVVLDPRNGFNDDRTLTKQDVLKLEERCLEKLLEDCSPSLDTIEMQVYFDTNYSPRREALQEVRRLAESRLSSASRDITDSRARTRQELEELYQRIVTYVLLRSGMGSPSDHGSVKQATAALQSVFPQTELSVFTLLPKADKERRLEELAALAAGIRLFNRAQETPDLRELLPAGLGEALPVVIEGIERELSASLELAWRYTSALERPTDPPDVHLKPALYNVRQHEVFLRVLLADAGSCRRNVEKLQAELASQVELLKAAVRWRKAVPTSSVFPLFAALSDVWSDLRREAELLSALRDLWRHLLPYLASQAKIFPEARVDELLEAAAAKTDQQRKAESSGERIHAAEMKTQEWLLPETPASVDDLPLQYNGFCGYTVVHSDGLLLPGNPDIGVLKHKEKLYAFSSKQAALEFSSRPDVYVLEIAERAKLFPELIGLLQLHQQMQPEGALVVKATTRCDGGTQTDTHPLESNIVESYEWNEWELRRKAIELTDLRTKVTRSTQTHRSHMRRENATQTWLPREAASQSGRDGGSGAPGPRVYLTGLRGPRTGLEVKTDLTRSAED